MNKKIFFIAMILFYKISFADDLKLSKTEEQKISESFKQLDQLESYVNAHEGITYNEIKNKNIIPENFQSKIYEINSYTNDKPWYKSKFFWLGFAAWFTSGISLVLAVVLADSKEDKYMTLYGCLAFAGLFSIFFIILVANDPNGLRIG